MIEGYLLYTQTRCEKLFYESGIKRNISNNLIDIPHTYILLSQ